MSALTIRAYNVGFGDAILVTVPERDARTGRESPRHLLIDVGNVQAGVGGDDSVFAPVVADIARRLRGRPVDLYVMTHEHLDHVQGLYHAAVTGGVQLDIDHAWLTASAAPDYAMRFPGAKRRLDAARTYMIELERHLAVSSMSPTMRAMIANNHPRRTSACVDYLRQVARVRTTYVSRSTRLRRGVHHPFREASLRVLAPEEDTTTYYGRFRPTPLHATESADPTAIATRPVEAPPGVDPDAFARLIESWRSDAGTNVLAIDRAANNTSIVFELEWRGWRMLFAGDAEQRSWLTIEQHLRPVHVLKVAHHASHNATPPDVILTRLFPPDRTDRRRRTAIISTCSGVYHQVPDPRTVNRLGEHCDTIVSTADVALGASIAVRLTGR